MALNGASVTLYERSSQFSERRRSLFPQNSVDSSEDSDLGCISPLSNSSYDENDESYNTNSNNINDYDVIGIVRRDISITPEVSPYKKKSFLLQQAVNTPNSKNSDMPITSGLKVVLPQIHIPKTPHDTLIVNSKLPKLSHKSITDSCSSVPSKRKLSPYNSPEPLNKSKIDIKNSKVRTTLFPEIDLILPTKRFYSSVDTNLEIQKDHKKESPLSKMEQFNTMKLSVPSSMYSRRQRSSKRSCIGKINAGVKHKIRRPRQRKIKPLPLAKSSLNASQINAMNYYLENLRQLKSASERQSLIENKENAAPEIATSLSSIMECSTVHSNQNISTNNILPDVTNMENQKKSNENSFSVSSNSLSTGQSFSDNFQDKEVSTSYHQFSMNPFATSFPFSNQVFTQASAGSDLSRKRPLSPTIDKPDQNKKFFKFSRGHKAVVNMNASIKLMVDHGKVSLLGDSQSKIPQQLPNLQKTAHQPPRIPNFESDDFTIDEPVMSQVIMDNILGTLADEIELPETKTKQQMSIVFSESQNPIASSSTSEVNISNTLQTPGSIVAAASNPQNLILSPISQMCDVTSGLALNSPKRVKNLSSLIESVGKSSKKELLLSPKASVGAKKKTLTLAERKFRKLHKNQMLLDAGQKKFGVTQCSECDFVYHIGDPSDEACHNSYHEAVPVLKFCGWKNERVVADFQKMGRIVQIKAGDPKLWFKKASRLMEVVDREIGHYGMEVNFENTQIFLYIKSKMIAGCLVAEQTSKGYQMLTVEANEADMCSERCYPVKCGVAKIWVSQNFRKMGIATALMNALKKNFFFGYTLSNGDIAFSSPTEMGKAFAKKYFTTSNFMIYFA